MTLSGVTRRTEGVRRARGSIAGSLSIEPFERSRWRLRRTRPVSYVYSIVRGPCLSGRTSSQARYLCCKRWSGTPLRRAPAGDARDGRSRCWEDTSGARASERARGRMAGRGCGLRGVMEDAVKERVEEELPCRQPFDETHGRPTPRARPRRWSTLGGSAESAGASGSPPAPGDTVRVAGSDTARPGSRSSGSGQSASAGRAGGIGAGIHQRRA